MISPNDDTIIRLVFNTFHYLTTGYNHLKAKWYKTKITFANFLLLFYLD